MTPTQRKRIASYLSNTYDVSLGEPIPGTGPKGAEEIPSDVDLKNWFLLSSSDPAFVRKIFRRNPRAQGLIKSALDREANATLSEWERKKKEIEEANANKLGTPRNPIKIFNIVDKDVKRKQ